jgi:hypothetical protein
MHRWSPHLLYRLWRACRHSPWPRQRNTYGLPPPLNFVPFTSHFRSAAIRGASPSVRAQLGWNAAAHAAVPDAAVPSRRIDRQVVGRTMAQMAAGGLLNDRAIRPGAWLIRRHCASGSSRGMSIAHRTPARPLGAFQLFRLANLNEFLRSVVWRCCSQPQFRTAFLGRRKAAPCSRRNETSF